METEEELGSASQAQNLQDLQNYLVTFKTEIENSDDVLPSMDNGDVSDIYSGTSNHLQDAGDGEVSGQFSSGFYSEQEGMLGSTLSDDPTQQQMGNLVSSVDADEAAKGGIAGIDLDSVQNSLAQYGDSDSQLTHALPDLQAAAGDQGIVLSSLEAGLETDAGKMLQIVALGGDSSNYLCMGDGQQMQILSAEELGLAPDSMEQINGSIDLNLNSSSTVSAISTSTSQMALVSLAGNSSDLLNSGIAAAPSEVKDGAGLFANGMPSLVAVPSAGDGGTPQLFALQGSSGLQFNGILGTDDAQALTMMPPSDLGQTGDLNYVLILRPPDGEKNAMASLAPLCNFKQEPQIADAIVSADGVPKKMFGGLNNQELMCSYCDYTSTKRYLLTRHMKSHSDDRPFKCDVCQRGFKTAASLLNHVNTHTGRRPYKCKMCEAAFTTSGELVRHIRYRHTFEKPHRCPECDYASVELSKLKRHMRSHTGERPYKCPCCPYASPDTYKLKRHMRIHTGEKPYECDICHARFTQSNSLKAHKLIHSGNKPVYKCSICPTTCGRKTDLKIHFNKLHAHGCPMECKKCGQTFADRYSYKKHIRVHDMEKCFKCSLCDFLSLNEKVMEQHLANHHVTQYECEDCKLLFALKPLLDKHRIVVHNKMDDSSTTEEPVQDGGESGHVTTSITEDSLEPPSESEDTPHLLNAPLTSGTLHKNLMQDIKEGKLGDIPQVVIVHPDGSSEELSSKLSGDKWSIEELFSTATNYAQTDKDDENDGNYKPIEAEDPQMNMEHSFVVGETDAVDDPPPQASVTLEEATPGNLPENPCQEAGVSTKDASQLCEASTQAEWESDTDSNGEAPEQETESSSKTLNSKTNQEATDQSHPVSTLIMSQPSSSLSTLTKKSYPEETIQSSVPNSYVCLKSLITKKPVVLRPPSSSLAPSPLIASVSSALKSPTTVTKVLDFPKVLSNSSSLSVKTNSGHQYSLLKNLNISGALKPAPAVTQTKNDSVVKVRFDCDKKSNIKSALASALKSSTPSSPTVAKSVILSESPAVGKTGLQIASLISNNAVLSNHGVSDSKGMNIQKEGNNSASQLTMMNESLSSTAETKIPSSNVPSSISILSLSKKQILVESSASVLPGPKPISGPSSTRTESYRNNQASTDPKPSVTLITQKDAPVAVATPSFCDNRSEGSSSLSITKTDKKITSSHSEKTVGNNTSRNVLSSDLDFDTSTEDIEETPAQGHQKKEASKEDCDLMKPSNPKKTTKKVMNEGSSGNRKKNSQSGIEPKRKSLPHQILDSSKESKAVKRQGTLDQSLVVSGKRVRKAVVKASM